MRKVAYSTDSREQQKIDAKRRETGHNTDEINLSRQIFDSMRFNGRYFTSEMQREDGAFTRNHHTDYEQTDGQTREEILEEKRQKDAERERGRVKALRMCERFLDQQSRRK